MLKTFPLKSEQSRLDKEKLRLINDGNSDNTNGILFVAKKNRKEKTIECHPSHDASFDGSMKIQKEWSIRENASNERYPIHC